MRWTIRDVANWEVVCFVKEAGSLSLSFSQDELSPGDIGRLGTWLLLRSFAEKRTEGREMNPVTQALIVATGLVGMPEIEQTTLPEFGLRCCITEKVLGNLLIEDGNSRPLTLEEMNSHCGLKTEASFLTREEWLERMVQS